MLRAYYVSKGICWPLSLYFLAIKKNSESYCLSLILSEKIDLKNQSDSLCYQSEKQLKELGDKVSKEDQNKIEGLIKELREAVQKDESDKMKDLSTKLQNELMEIGKKIYSQGTNVNNAQSSNNSGDSAIDADFSETK